MSEWRQLGGKGGVGLMVREDAIALMKSLELDSLDRALTFQGGEVVVQGRRRTVRRIATANGPALFLKQSYRGGRGSLVRGLLRRGRRKSSSVIEFENLQWLDELGFQAARPLAWGQRHEGLTEGVSCLVTEEVGGTDLERYLERRAPQVPRTRAFDELLGDAVRDLLVRLVDEGIDFEDLVPKHLFLDRAGDGVSITLIDAFRLRRRRGAANLMAKSLSRLACHLSVFAVSSAERMRFVVSLVGREHARALFAQAQRESGKLLLRRSARRNLSRHARGVDPCRRSNAAGDLVFDPDRREEIDALGLDPEDARGSRQTLGRERLPLRFELVTGSIQDLRDLFTVHHVLRGFCHLPGLLMRHFGSGADDEGFLIFDRLGGETLSESLSSADPDRLQRIAAALDEALVQLLFMGIRPTASFCEWFVVQGSRVLVQPRLPFEFRYVDGKDDLKRIRARIDAELDGGGVSLPRREKVRAALRFVRPGLLGHEEPLA